MSLATLIVSRTKEAIMAAGLAIAQGQGVPTTAWQVGNPTRASFWFLSTILESLETIASNFVKSGFLDFMASDPTLYNWLVVVAQQCFSYSPREATSALVLVRLTNVGGGLFEFDSGDLTVKNSVTGVTYHNTTGGTLASGSIATPTTLDLYFVADTAGSVGSASAGQINSMVTTYLGVSCSNASACVGQDAETAQSIVANCRAKLGRATVSGPSDAYVSVALDSTLTGTTVPTKAISSEDSNTGLTYLTVATDSGGVDASVVTAVQAAIDTWVRPLTVTAVARTAATKTVNITLTATAYDSWGVTVAEGQAAIELALRNWIAARPIGGDIVPPAVTGSIAINMLEAAARSASSEIIAVAITVPAMAVAMATIDCAVLGTVTWTSPLALVQRPGGA